MTKIDNMIIDHYGKGSLLDKIIKGLKEEGLDPDNLQPHDLSPIDEFHIGGRVATEYAVGKMDLRPEYELLDIGCGIGGAARYIAGTFDCQVTGIDLTPDYIAVAKDLSARVGLAEKTRFEAASALDMPLEGASFDAAITFHVAMNIADREGLYKEIARVMKPGAILCVYDVMKTGDEALIYPVPWAETEETSYLTSLQSTRDLLAQAGFTVTYSEDRRDFALDCFKENQTKAPSPLGTHLLFGEGAKEKFGNIRKNVEQGRVAPTLIIAKRN